MGKKEKTNEEIFPSVYHAYDIALKSYDWAIQGLNSINGALDRLLTWVSSITLGSMAYIISNQTYQCGLSVWFYLGMVFFLGVIITWAIAKSISRGSLLSADILYEKWLRFNEWEFKKNIIFFAGTAYKKNRARINKKAKLYDIMVILFTLEIVSFFLFIVWR